MTTAKPDAAPIACPVMVSVNVDVETIDAIAAGEAGLLGRYSYGRYGAREGIWRLLRVFDEMKIPATFFVEPEDATRHPDLVKVIAGEGHEIGVLGHAVRALSKSQSADKNALERQRDAIEMILGQAPAGFRAVNGLLGAETLILIADLGYRYDSSFQDDDLPYLFDVGKGVLGELPVFDYLTDATFYANRHTPDRVRKAWFEEIDGLTAAAGYVHLTLHARGDIGSTRAVRCDIVREVLAHLAGRMGVAFFRGAELVDKLLAESAPTEKLPNWNLSAFVKDN